MDRKAALELSTNFLVMLIIAIASFSLGIAIIYRLSDSMTQAGDRIDEETERKIERQMVSGGEIFALPFNRLDLRRGDDTTLAFGIRNNDPKWETFNASVDCVGAYDHDDNEICDSLSTCDNHCGHWAYIPHQNIEIDYRDREMESVFIVVDDDAEQGRYIFRMEVEANDGSGVTETYGTPKRFYVNIG